MSSNNSHKVSGKVWLEYQGNPLLGKGGAKILETIQQVESISKAAQKTGMSYRYVWNYLSKLEKRLGNPVITTFKGGTKGGGGAKLTELGITLINEYKRAEMQMTKTMGFQSQKNDKNAKINCFEATIQNLNEKMGLVQVDLDHPKNLFLVLPKKMIEDFDLQLQDIVEVTIIAQDIKIIKKE